MLSLGFLLWGIYLGSYPFSQEYESLYSAGFLVAAVLQLFIAVSMIVVVGGFIGLGLGFALFALRRPQGGALPEAPILQLTREGSA